MVNNKSQLNKKTFAGNSRLIISVKEARKLLGVNFKSMDDNQIEEIITKLNLIAKGFIASQTEL